MVGFLMQCCADNPGKVMTALISAMPRTVGVTLRQSGRRSPIGRPENA
jgi:hypothetical protein